MRILRPLTAAACAAALLLAAPGSIALAAGSRVNDAPASGISVSESNSDPADTPSDEPTDEPSVDPSDEPTDEESVPAEEEAELLGLALTAAPTGVRGEAGNASAYLDFNPVAKASGYKVRVTVSANPDNVPSPGTGSVSVNVANSSAIVTKLSNGVTYALEVASVDAAGVTSDYAAPVYATPALVPNVMGTPSLVQITRSSLSVKWTAGTVGAGVGPISGYRISYDSLDGYDDIVHTTDADDLNDTADGLIPDSTYAVRVFAVNAVGAGPGSIIPSLQVPSGPVAPTNLHVTSSGNAVINLAWDPIDTATSYKLSVTVASNPENIPNPSLGTISYTGASAKVNALTNGVTYAFKVAAIDGNQGDWSQSILAAPTEAPAPINVTIAGVGNQVVYLDWSDSLAATAYRVTVTVQDAHGIANPSLGSTSVSTTNSSSTTTGLTNGVDYAFTVAARVDGNYTDESAPVLATPIPVPNKMAAPTASAITGTSVTLRWTAASISGAATPVSSYTVEYWPSSNPDAVKIRTWDASVLTGQITGLSTGVEYNFTIAASNDAGSGPDSPVFKTVAANKPGAVMDLSAERSTDGTVISLDWNPPAGTGGASISKYTVSISPAGGTSSVDVVNTRAQFNGLDPATSYKVTVYAYTTAGAGPGASVTSLAGAPSITSGPDMDASGKMTVTFGDMTNDNYGYQVEAYQIEQLAGVKKPVLKTSVSVVTADTVACANAVCSGIWNSFGDNVNGQTWLVRVRATDGAGGYTNWSIARPSAPGSAQVLTSAQKIGSDWYVNYIGNWAERTSSGVWGMDVNGADSTDGQSGNLGPTPGKQTVTLTGIGGSSSYTYVLPDTPVIPDTPIISQGAVMGAGGDVTVIFSANPDSSVSYEAVAEQAIGSGSELSLAVDSITCSSGSCTATWEAFGDAVNAKAWTFKVRARSDSAGMSEWASSTPAAPVDAAGVVAASQSGGTWRISYVADWGARTDNGVWSMSVDGAPAPTGVSGDLGSYPGKVPVVLAGIGGSSSIVLDLPDKPLVPDTPIINGPASINAFSTVRLAFSANSDSSDVYEARAWQSASATYVPADELQCSAGTCTAVWNNFSSYLNGQAWAFQVRAKSTAGLESPWAEQSSPAPASATELTETYRSSGNWYVEYTGDWNTRFSLNVATMLVNNQPAPDGVSASLGAYPGRVTVKLIGLGGVSTARYDLPDQPVPPNAPVITGGPAMDAAGTVTVAFTGDSSASFEARAGQSGSYVDASNVNCAAGSCTATWSGFGARINGAAWSFEVRGVAAGLYSNWVSRTASAPAPAENLVEAYEQAGQWYVRFTGDWNARAELGVWVMNVNGKAAAGGVSAALGAYPGDVAVNLSGLGGSSSTTLALPDTPPIPDVPTIVSGPVMDASGTVTVTFTGNADASFSAQAVQGGSTVEGTTNCAAGTCTATWPGFGANVNSAAWQFQVRATRAGQSSDWASASASAPAAVAPLVSSYQNGTNWYVKYTGDWATRGANGIWSMTAAGKNAPGGVSESLGQYPGTVTVAFQGIGGQSSTTIALPDGPTPVKATGGSIVNYGGWTYHYWMPGQPGTFSVSNGGDVTVVMIGGGGGGGWDNSPTALAGSGGGGQVLQGKYTVKTGVNYNVTAGTGGSGGNSGYAAPGNSSNINGSGLSVTATGGGAGSQNAASASGGFNGGGGGGYADWGSCSLYPVWPSPANGGYPGSSASMWNGGYGCSGSPGQGGGSGGSANDTSPGPGMPVTLLPITSVIPGVVGSWNSFGGGNAASYNNGGGGSTYSGSAGAGGVVVIAYPQTLKSPLLQNQVNADKPMVALQTQPYTLSTHDGQIELRWEGVPDGVSYEFKLADGTSVCSTAEPVCTFTPKPGVRYYLQGSIYGGEENTAEVRTFSTTP